jgi:hypothetical protein
MVAMRGVGAAIVILAGAAWYCAGSYAEKSGLPFEPSWIAGVTGAGIAKLIGVLIGVSGLIGWVLAYGDDRKS